MRAGRALKCLAHFYFWQPSYRLCLTERRPPGYTHRLLGILLSRPCRATNLGISPQQCAMCRRPAAAGFDYKYKHSHQNGSNGETFGPFLALRAPHDRPLG